METTDSEPLRWVSQLLGGTLAQVQDIVATLQPPPRPADECSPVGERARLSALEPDTPALAQIEIDNRLEAWTACWFNCVFIAPSSGLSPVGDSDNRQCDRRHHRPTLPSTDTPRHLRRQSHQRLELAPSHSDHSTSTIHPHRSSSETTNPSKFPEKFVRVTGARTDTEKPRMHDTVH